MPLPLIGFFPWLVALFGSLVTSIFTWFLQRVVYEKAVQYALITAGLIAIAALTLSVSLTIKAAIIALRVTMPTSLGMATYFLPSNINLMIGVIVTARVARSVYRWTVTTMAAYIPTQYGGSKYAF